jgi:hypothetical protein
MPVIVEEHNIRKIRLWCSEKDDHAGAVSSFAAKNRMEFYPDQLMDLGLYAEAVAMCENVERDVATGGSEAAA